MDQPGDRRSPGRANAVTGFPLVVPFVDHLGVAHGGMAMAMAMTGRSRTHHAGDEQTGLVTIETKTKG